MPRYEVTTRYTTPRALRAPARHADTRTVTATGTEEIQRLMADIGDDIERTQPGARVSGSTATPQP